MAARSLGFVRIPGNVYVGLITSVIPRSVNNRVLNENPHRDDWLAIQNTQLVTVPLLMDDICVKYPIGLMFEWFMRTI